ncbi:MAG: CoB--CoM heterodisulfide reductase iron-sulfur subunit A family protein, partial [Deltaproteobacteria bacterium]|nr:CoB--CoM heterodisulfide reductase iron-sulfur subunit A family protein [Deltaproteobacteria bacterium]
MKTADPLQTSNRVLVIGGGMGGIRTALDLAEAQKNVVLIDKANAIGGLMTLLDRTFPTNNCDLCTISSTLSETNQNQFIQLMPLTQIAQLKGETGNFTAVLSTTPRYIDLDLCTACGECRRQFPECVDFNPGLDHRAPTCMRYPQATPQAFSIDLNRCQDPQALAACCPAGAILLNDRERQIELPVAAIVLAPGAAIFDPSGMDNLSYDDPDVLTSLEYERILSASGPTQGRLICPSDGRVPAKIAWIQCVGSRGMQQGAASYCSSVCCMFALKEAMVTKERFQDDIETTVSYMDMRTFGKDYERYYERSRKKYGVRFVRSRPHTVIRHPEEGQLTIQFAPEEGGPPKEERFDLVVLSTGFRINDELRQTAEHLGVDLNVHGFARTGAFNPVATSRPGVYVCGLFEGPKDIPDTMVQASAAACRASSHVFTRTISSESDGELIPERDVIGQAPRIGVFICDCGEDIGGVISVPELAAFAAKLGGVILAEGVGHGCSRESMNHIQEAIINHKLNRVVIGGCSPRTHEARFQDVLRRAGLNKYLLEIANLREQDTWVHLNRSIEAAAKARQFIRAAVRAVQKARPLLENQLPINRDILVVGGGIAGMTASFRLAEQGFKVFLAERRSFLGGVANLVHRTLEGEDVQSFVQDLIRRTMSHDNIQVITNAIVVDHSGRPGLYKTGLQVGPQMFYRQINHGVTILATGPLPNRPNDYLLGRHEAVMTQLDADSRLEETPEKIKTWETVVMIQGVGSRQPDNPNCSRICCQAAIKNALRILEKKPEAQIFILYRDMRTYGFQEDYYRLAREKGVIF